jgi:hypothetical protein
MKAQNSLLKFIRTMIPAALSKSGDACGIDQPSTEYERRARSCMTWRRGFIRLWIVLTAAWIATIVAIDRPDKQFVLARQPIEISYGGTIIEFPVGTDQDTISGAINKWIADRNATVEKIRTGEALSPLSDEELWPLAWDLGLSGKVSAEGSCTKFR